MLVNKVAIVTGGGKGIGRAISLDLAESGADIAIIYSGDQKSAMETSQQIIAKGRIARIYKCDVSSFNDTKEITRNILDDFKKIDILVNNAGITKDMLMMRMKEEDWDSVIDINLKGAFNMMKHLFTHFSSNREGKIVNISSISGIDGNAGQTNYSASKAGLIGLTKSAAKEFAARKVTCNVVAPGFIETNMTDCLNDQIKTLIIERIPLKRIGRVCEVAKLVTFLASEASDYITGQVFRVDGGLTI